jgi:putative DNA primase/helicase
MRLVPFIETISDDEKDQDLPAKLKAEADGILAWIVVGAVAWNKDGLTVPQEVIAATNDYRNEMDSIGAFLAEKCMDGDKLSSYAADLYAAYCRWCESSGEHSLSQRRLGTTLAERGYISGRCSYRNVAIWKGIGLKAEESNTKGPEL